jgi:transposase
MVYPQHTRERAVRLFRERAEGDDRTDAERLRDISSKLGMNKETLRQWVYQAEVDEGLREGVSSATQAEVAELRRKNAELEQTVEILKAAASFFARECDPLRPSSADSSPSTGNGSESHRSVGS